MAVNPVTPVDALVSSVLYRAYQSQLEAAAAQNQAAAAQNTATSVTPPVTTPLPPPSPLTTPSYVPSDAFQANALVNNRASQLAVPSATVSATPSPTASSITTGSTQATNTTTAVTGAGMLDGSPNGPQPIREPSEMTKAMVARTMVSEQMEELPAPPGPTEADPLVPDAIFPSVLRLENPFIQVEYNQSWQVSADALAQLLTHIDPSGEVSLQDLRTYQPRNQQEQTMLGYLRQLPIFRAMAQLSADANTLDASDVKVMVKRQMVVVADAQLSVFIKD
jgi:hypothetical protein